MCCAYVCTCTTVGKIRNQSRVENVCIQCGSALCAASLPASLWDCYKRISDVDAGIEGEAERTKRMLYHCGVQSQWVLFYANSQHNFYSKHRNVLAHLKLRKGWKSEEEKNKIRITKTETEILKDLLFQLNTFLVFRRHLMSLSLFRCWMFSIWLRVKTLLIMKNEGIPT